MVETQAQGSNEKVIFKDFAKLKESITHKTSENSAST